MIRKSLYFLIMAAASVVSSCNSDRSSDRSSVSATTESRHDHSNLQKTTEVKIADRQRKINNLLSDTRHRSPAVSDSLRDFVEFVQNSVSRHLSFDLIERRGLALVSSREFKNDSLGTVNVYLLLSEVAGDYSLIEKEVVYKEMVANAKCYPLAPGVRVGKASALKDLARLYARTGKLDSANYVVETLISDYSDLMGSVRYGNNIRGYWASIGLENYSNGLWESKNYQSGIPLLRKYAQKSERNIITNAASRNLAIFSYAIGDSLTYHQQITILEKDLSEHQDWQRTKELLALAREGRFGEVLRKHGH